VRFVCLTVSSWSFCWSVVSQLSVSQSVCCQFSVSLFSVCCQSAVSLLSVCFQSAVNLLSVYYKCAVSLLSVCYQSVINLLSVWYQSVINLLSVFYQSAVSLSVSLSVSLLSVCCQSFAFIFCTVNIQKASKIFFQEFLTYKIVLLSRVTINYCYLL